MTTGLISQSIFANSFNTETKLYYPRYMYLYNFELYIKHFDMTNDEQNYSLSCLIEMMCRTLDNCRNPELDDDLNYANPLPNL